MESKDIKPQISNSNPDPKPTEDAQSLVETIIPSTEDSASTTTKEQGDAQNTSPEAAYNGNDNDDSKVEADAPNIDEKPGKEGEAEADGIETVAP